jgi:hypothetical protein
VLDTNIQFNPISSGFYTVPALEESILSANLAGRTNVTLFFDEKMFTNATDLAPVAMPPTFTGHNNSSGVAFSVDSTNWFRIVSLTGPNSTTSYQTQSFYDFNGDGKFTIIDLSAFTQNFTKRKRI